MMVMMMMMMMVHLAPVRPVVTNGSQMEGIDMYKISFYCLINDIEMPLNNTIFGSNCSSTLPSHFSPSLFPTVTVTAHPICQRTMMSLRLPWR